MTHLHRFERIYWQNVECMKKVKEVVKCFEKRSSNSPRPLGSTAVYGMGKARCEVGWNWQHETPNDYDLWYALDGSGVMEIGGIRIRLSGGVAF